tara:strand:+ start:4687 stop:5739 length:1053 start_codon:yes stop_codon:yes gene_type:complete
MASNLCHQKLVTLLSRQGNQLDRLYAKKARELSMILRRYKLNDARNPWKGNKALEKEVDKVLSGLDEGMKTYMISNMRKAANLSNNCHDAMIDSYTDGVKVDPIKKAAMMTRNTAALSAWEAYRIKGLSISSRVWNTSKQTKEQLEFFLKEGLADGTSASTLATDIKKYLKEPNKRFRRIRDENGKLVMSAPAKNYKSGRGIYKSSYKNALRLTRNEINLSYRNADNIRRENLDFVVGVRVNLSDAHPEYDICDELQGKYPKEFVFTGWHVNCLCFTTSILMSKKDFVQYLKTGTVKESTKVKSVPERASKYLNEKSDKLKSMNSKPYWLTDNFKNTKGGLDLKTSSKPK